MIKLSRDTWLVIGLVIVLAIITSFVVIWRARTATPPALSSTSNEPDGAHALSLWLEQKGYQVMRNSMADFYPPAEANLIFILEPSYDSNQNHWQLLDDWVKAGGTLVVAGEGEGADTIFNYYNSSTLGIGQGRDIPVTVQSPLLASPSLDNFRNLELVSMFETGRDDLLVLLARGDYPILFTFRLGAGRVIMASFIYPFMNAGLKEAGNPELVLNLLTWAGQSHTVWFDDWHHGQGKHLDITGPQDWIRFTPAGHAFLFTAVILFLALLLQGRNFGRPLPLPQKFIRRTPLEYITALANLNRRAGNRSEVLSQYYQSLKIQLARRYRINPALPDEEYLMSLAKYNPDLDLAGLRNLFLRLRNPQVGENEMVKLAAETSKWLLNTQISGI